MDLFEAALARPRERLRALFRLQGRGGDPLPRRQRLRRLQRRERRLSAGHLRRGRRHRRDGRRRPHRDRRGAGGRRRPDAGHALRRLPPEARRVRPRRRRRWSSPTSRGERARSTVGACCPAPSPRPTSTRAGDDDRPPATSPAARWPASTSPTSTTACDAAAIAELCRRAETPHGLGRRRLHLAAVRRRRRSGGSPTRRLRVATVVNFPAGDEPLEDDPRRDPRARSPTAPTRSTSSCRGAGSPPATPRRSPLRCARSRTSAARRR